MADLLGLAGRQADEVAVGLHQRRRDALRLAEAGMLHQVAHLAMDRHQQLGPQPAVERG